LLAGDLRDLSLKGVTRVLPESTAGGTTELVDATTPLSLGVDPTPETTQSSSMMPD